MLQRLDQRGDKKAMNKLAQRLQKEQPFLLQFAAAVRNDSSEGNMTANGFSSRCFRSRKRCTAVSFRASASR